MRRKFVIAGLVSLAVNIFPDVALAAPPDFPPIDNFDEVTWNDYLVTEDDWPTAHVQFRTPSGLTCSLSVDAYSFECWGPLHGAPAGANHVRGNVIDRQPFPDFEEEPQPLPDMMRISWRGATCGVAGPVTACYQVDRGFILDAEHTVVTPVPENNNGQVLTTGAGVPPSSGSASVPAPPSAPALPTAVPR